MEELYKNFESLEVEVRDSTGKYKDTRFLEYTQTGYREFVPNKFYILLKKLGLTPPKIFGKWQTYIKET